MEKFARRCDITGKGINEGYVWGDGTFYTSTTQITIDEFRSDISDGAYDFDSVGKEELLSMSDHDLLQYGYDNDVFYYTEWEEIDDDYYYDADGNEYEL